MRRTSPARPVGAVPTVASAARAIAHRVLGRVRHGRLTVVESGRSVTFGGAADLDATIVVRSPRFWTSIIAKQSVGLGESYMRGDWDSDDPVAVLRLLGRNLDRLNPLGGDPLEPFRRAAAFVSRLRPPTGDDDRRNIRAHYDLSDDFFKLFLPESMAYSCALFDEPGMTLEEASLAKFDRICRILGLDRSANVIEIGTGWGGFAVHAARHYGCRVTTTTISERQYAYALDWVRREELQDRVTVLREHYRDLRGTFTHLVSIEMIEAVDWRLYDEFFATVGRLLQPDGLAAIQAITVEDRGFATSKHHIDFIRKHIFPGGCLPSITAMLDSITRASDLRLIDLRDIGEHYATTLRMWREALDGRLDDARALGFDDEFLRMWRFYFLYCEAGFRERLISDVQMVFAKPGWRPPARAAAERAAALERSRVRRDFVVR